MNTPEFESTLSGIPVTPINEILALNLGESSLPQPPERPGVDLEQARDAKEAAKKLLSDKAEIGIIAFARRGSGYILKILLKSEPSDPNFRSDYSTINGVPVDFVTIPEQGQRNP